MNPDPTSPPPSIPKGSGINPIQRLPYGSAATNTLNTPPQGIVVKFIYKRDPRSKTKTYLKDPVVSVTAAFMESAPLPIETKKDADQGIAVFDSLQVGRYTVTPDYSKLDVCQFDYDSTPQDIVLAPGETKTVIFEVEPLYQKIQLVAHCLLAISDYKFVLTDEDKKKVEVESGPNGKQSFKFKTFSQPAGFYGADDLNPKFPITKVKIESNPEDGSGTLTLKSHKLPDEYYKLEDIALDMVNVVEKTIVNNPRQAHIHEIIYKPAKSFNDLILNDEDKKRATLNHLGKTRLTLHKKPEQHGYMSVADIDDLKNKNAAKIEYINPDPDKTYVYKIQFKPKFNELTYEKKELKGGWKGKYHGLEDDKADMKARLDLVSETLEQAYIKAKDDPKILKVFMIPECFFQGRYGSYLVVDADYLFSELLKMVGDVKWRDWMFVFGTVNLTFSEGTPGKDEGIREMMNYSPVIRGGLGSADKSGSSGGQSDEHLRLIQKLVNSAELLDESEIIHHEKEARVPSVNEAVQFQATQNEEEIGSILEKLLKEDPDFGTRHGLPKELWQEVKVEFQKLKTEWGLTRLVRYIRDCNVQDKPTDLLKWGYFSGYENQTKKHLKNAKSVLASPEMLIIRFIKDAWDKSNQDNKGVKPEITKSNIKSILADIKPRLGLLNEEFNITLPSQQKTLFFGIESLSDLEDGELFEFFNDNKTKILPDDFGASICPLIKKVLELYFAEKKLPEEKMTPAAANLDYRDYCFASARKAGPWLTWDKAETLDPCKKLVFGLEICADHASGRLANLVQEPPMDEFDETLIEDLKLIEELKLIDKNDNAFTDEAREKQNEEITARNKEIAARNEEITAENKKIKVQNQPTIDRITKKRAQESRNQNKPDVTIDIHLLPSAGMFPTKESVVARKGGYLFNCDGWNKGEEFGVNTITEYFEGPERMEGEVGFANPVTPHTAIAKGGGVPLNMDQFKPERIKLETVINKPERFKEILNKSGLGELHVYKELDLPKN